MKKYNIEMNFGKKFINLLATEFDDCDHFINELGKIEGKNVSEEMMTL